MDKLLKQVGDVEEAIDALIKLTKEDLWKRDLDDFINEWRFQLEDERKSLKKIDGMARRASNKLKIGAGGGRKRKNNYDSDDSDFGGAAPQKAKKPAVPKREPGGMLGYLNAGAKTKTSPKIKAPTKAAKGAQAMLELLKPTSKVDKIDTALATMDGASGSDASKAKAKAPAPAKKPTRKLDSDDEDDFEEADEEIVRPTAGRKPRAAAAKPVRYNTLDDSDSDGEDMIFDVGKMVKGLPPTGDTESRPLFSASTSRPGSSAGLPRKSTSVRPTVDLDGDDTDYSKLAPPTTKKGPAITASKTILSDDEDDSLDNLPAAPAPKPTAKPTFKAPPKPKVTKKAAPPPPAPKIIPLSPAAKAYAAKKAKLEKAAREAEKDDFDDLDNGDEVDKVANEMLDDDDEEDEDEDVAPTGRRPARRAAAAAPKGRWVVSDDEEEEEEEESAMVEEESEDEFEESEM